MGGGAGGRRRTTRHQGREGAEGSLLHMPEGENKRNSKEIKYVMKISAVVLQHRKVGLPLKLVIKN